MIEIINEHESRKPVVTGHWEWLEQVATKHGFFISEITYIFCTDERLLELNQQFLNHDFYTDILTFDRSEGKYLAGDVYISLDRVDDNSSSYGVSFEEELRRVMAHGMLHMIGFKDKSEQEQEKMRNAENEALELFHVKQ
jgi:rRNA maturation RNase YbeY